jgi:ABC-type antimicrobial peptide transport system permease subunit
VRWRSSSTFGGRQEQVRTARTPPRIRATLLGLYAAFGLILSAVGIYAMAAYVSAVRTGELGIRMVLGADPGEVVGILLRECAWTVGVGLVLGSCGAVLFAGTMERLVYGVQILDPGGFALSAMLLGLIGFTAALWPALRVSRMAPLDALHTR